MGFRGHVIIRILAVLLSGYCAIYLFLDTPFWLLSIWVLLVTVGTTASLVQFVERNRRDMTSFLTSIQQNDFTTTFPTNKKKSSTNWYHEFNIINNKFQELRSQRQSNYHFLEAIVEHTGVPLICYDEETRKITLMNEAAKQLFQKPFLDSLAGLKKIAHNLPALLNNMHSGDKKVYNFSIGNEVIPLTVLAKELVLEKQSLKLIAFQNIKHELEEKELESWQKLIRVLTHEIKNSAIPISTLSSVISQMIINEQGDLKNISELGKDDVQDLKNGLKTVEKRSQGLVNFVENYSKLSKIPEPKTEKISVPQLFTNVEQLMKEEAAASEVGLTFSSKKIEINIDQELIEQVLINLVKNAIHASKDHPFPLVEVEASQHDGQIIITIRDNGIGISRQALEDIFIPFFTTKQDGSGIGLSLSRQIMKAHGGTISVKSEEANGSLFQLRF